MSSDKMQVQPMKRDELSKTLERAHSIFSKVSAQGVAVAMVCERVAAMPLMQAVAAEPDPGNGVGAGITRVMRCISTIVQLGLEPGPMKEVDILPFQNSVKRKDGSWGKYTELVVSPTYNGLIKLATNTGRLKHITSFVVREGDKIVDRRGTNPCLEYEPGYKPEAPAIRYYAVAHYADGSVDWEAVTPEQVTKMATRMAYDKDAGKKIPKVNPIWKDGGDFADEFGRAKAVRRLAKRLPRDSRFAMALSLADAGDVGGARISSDDEGRIIDIAPSDFSFDDGVDPETGEVFDGEGEQAPPANPIAARRASVAKPAAPVKDVEFEAAPADTPQSPEIPATAEVQPDPKKELTTSKSVELARKYVEKEGVLLSDVMDFMRVTDLFTHREKVGYDQFTSDIKAAVKAVKEMVEQ